MVVAWVGGGCPLSFELQHELARRQSSPCTCLYNPTMTLQTCLQARGLKQRFVSCSQVKRNVCKRVTKSTKIRNGMYDTNFFSAASGR